MMRHYNIVFMAETPAHADAVASLAGGPGETANRLHEVRLLSVMPGRQGHAIETLVEADMPALRAAGARTLGVFDVLSGFPGPAFLQFLSWEDASSRDAGLAQVERDESVQAARERAVADRGYPYYRVGSTWQFKPTPDGIPADGFAAPAGAKVSLDKIE
jgi:hypothetical protein